MCDFLIYPIDASPGRSLLLRGEVSPEQPVRSFASISNVVEKHIQLLVVVKVGSDDCANR